MRSFDLPDFRPDGQRPTYLQLAEHLAALITSGKIPTGTRMPPQRNLARQLGLSRTTVTSAYLELERMGLVRMRVGSGTFAATPVVPRPEPPPQGIRPRPSLRLGRITGLSDPGTEPPAGATLVAFDRGKLDAGAVEVEELRVIVDDLLGRYGGRVLGRETTQGCPRLRERISARAARQGMSVRPHEVLITAGAREAVELLVQTLVDPGDPVVVESPGYRGALQVLRAAGARLLHVPVDQEGMDVRALEDVLTWFRPRFIYTVPNFQNPAGVTMSLERRRRLLRLALEHRVPVVEDDAHGGIRYEGPDLPTLKSLDKHGIVFYVTTFSKTVFPGLRVGWVSAPELILERLAVAKEVSGLHTSSLSQWALAEYLDRGLLEQHLGRILPVFRRRRDRMLSALKTHAPDLTPFVIPQGGYFLWARLPEGVSASALLPEARRHGVAFSPGADFCAPGEGDGFLRLAFAPIPEPQIEEGIRRLAAALGGLHTSGQTG